MELRTQSEQGREPWHSTTYKLLLVAFSICSSRAVLAPEDHQLIILTASLDYAVSVFGVKLDRSVIVTISRAVVEAGDISGGWVVAVVYQPSDSRAAVVSHRRYAMSCCRSSLSSR